MELPKVTGVYVGFRQGGPVNEQIVDWTTASDTALKAVRLMLDTEKFATYEGDYPFAGLLHLKVADVMLLGKWSLEYNRGGE